MKALNLVLKRAVGPLDFLDKRTGYMRRYSFCLGLLFIILFSSALAGFDLNGILDKTLSDIQNNAPLSIAILIVLILSLITQVVSVDQTNYASGCIAGLGLATLLTGFEGSIGLVLILYSIMIKKTVNSYKVEHAKSVQRRTLS